MIEASGRSREFVRYDDVAIDVIVEGRGPLSGISLHDLARDIAEVIAALGGGRAVVVGHAYGNWVA